jgi:hypothetical protein
VYVAGELIDFANRIGNITDPAALKRIAGKAGYAGKKAGLDAAASDLGGDRSFSGFGRSIPLGVGYDDLGTMVQLNFRPAGLWKLAESGRSPGKPILPRNREALRTPDGPRARSTTGEWGGKGTHTKAVNVAAREVPKAAFKQFQVEVSKAAG